jgi:putative DNA-invertase from lambdoid prophage Rac
MNTRQGIQMSRTFLYARVSTQSQNAESQIVAARSAGFEIAPHRVVTETISGAVPALQRPSFARLLDRLEPGDTLVVTHLDRLGRSVVDIEHTWALLERMRVSVRCIALGELDFGSPTGKLTVNIMAAFAQFERDLHIDRTHAGMARAKASGTHVGRKRVLSARREREVQKRLKNGESIASLARLFQCSRQTISRAGKKPSRRSTAAHRVWLHFLSVKHGPNVPLDQRFNIIFLSHVRLPTNNFSVVICRKLESAMGLLPICWT